jgi:mRNA degradation ribonuclease J1/J2/exonuclease I
MGINLPVETLYSIAGLQNDVALLGQTNIVHHNVVHTDSDGIIRSLHLQIQKNKPNNISIHADYLLHNGAEEERTLSVFAVVLNEQQGMIKAEIAGHDVMGGNQRQFLALIKDLRYRLGEKNEWTNFVKAIERAGIKGVRPEWTNWPGLHPNGEIKAFLPHKIESESEPVFPALFLPGIIGCGPESYSGDKKKNHVFHVSNPDTGKDVILNYAYEKGKTPQHMIMRCTVTTIDDDVWLEYPLYEIVIKAESNKEGYGRIRSFKIHHANAPQGGLDTIPLSDRKKMAVAMKAVRMLNRTMRGGEKAYREDLEKNPINRRLYLPSEIWSLSGLNDVLMPQMPAPARGRFCYTPMGGQNTKRVFSDFDYHIGGNSHRFDYYGAGQAAPDSIIIDMGVTFHDDFDLTFTNLDRYFRHKTNTAHVPEHNVLAIALTHRHKDHISMLAYLAKHGYDLPMTIMPPLGVRQIKREMAELKIDKHIREEIMSKFVVLDDQHISHQATADRPDKMTINGTDIEIYWEYLEGDLLNQKERYPVFKINDFTVRVGPMPHSDPGFMYEVNTPAGSHLHTGDFKLDPTIQLHMPSFKTWLMNCQAASLSIDSTGTTRDADERTPWESEIKRSIVHLFNENPDHRFICPVLGSNTSRFTTLIAAMGEAGKKFLIVDGKALEDLLSDLDNVHDIKKWALRTHGVTIARKGTKEAHRIYDEEPDSNYVLAVTGTQLEPTSSLNRAIANWLPSDRYEIKENDIIAPLQGPIPVGDNMQRRWAAKYFAEVFHGCRFILPEMVEKECDLKLSGSGHASPADIRELYSYLPNLQTVFPIHGGPEQLQAGQAIAEQGGLVGIIANNFDNYAIDKKGGILKLKTETGELVGVKSHLPDEYSFWLKRHYSTTVAPVPLEDSTAVGLSLSQFEQGLLRSLNVETRSMLAQAARFHLSRTFNMSAQGGFLTGRYKFGIEKYKGDIYDEKCIGAVCAFDTETTGTDERFDCITQFSMKVWDLSKKVISESEFRQKIPDYVVENPEALLVTVTDPEEKDDREVHPVLFTDQILDALKKAKNMSKALARKRMPKVFAANPATRAKMLFIAHNFPFDDRQLRTLLRNTLVPGVRPHSTDGVIGLDTIHIARAIHTIYPGRLNVRKYPDSEFFNFTLQALCEENGISYDLRKAHNSALYDSERAMKLFWKMEEIAPDIVKQMIFNADYGTAHLLNDMVGHDTGIGGPHPVFSYISRRRNRTDIRMGAYIGTLDGGSKVVVANLSYNPQDILSLPAEEIAKRLSDKHEDALEIIDLKQNPMVFPGRYFYEQNTSKKFPREMFDRRARMVGEYLNYRDVDLGMTNIHERLAEAWRDQRGAIMAAFEISAAREPDLNDKAIKILRDAQNYGMSMRADSGRMGAKKSFNPPAQETSSAIRQYRELFVEYLTSQTGPSLKQVNEAYKKLVSSRLSEGQMFLVSNLQYDVDKTVMPPSQITSVEGYRAFHMMETTNRAIESLNKLETDDNHREKMVGRSFKKRRIHQKIKERVEALKRKTPYDKQAMRRFVTPWKYAA